MLSELAIIAAKRGALQSELLELSQREQEVKKKLEKSVKNWMKSHNILFRHLLKEGRDGKYVSYRKVIINFLFSKCRYTDSESGKFLSLHRTTVLYHRQQPLTVTQLTLKNDLEAHVRDI